MLIRKCGVIQIWKQTDTSLVVAGVARNGCENLIKIILLLGYSIRYQRLSVIKTPKDLTKVKNGHLKRKGDRACIKKKIWKKVILILNKIYYLIKKTGNMYLFYKTFFVIKYIIQWVSVNLLNIEQIYEEVNNLEIEKIMGIMKTLINIRYFYSSW